MATTLSTGTSEGGTHGQLMETSGLYADLFTLQAAAYT